MANSRAIYQVLSGVDLLCDGDVRMWPLSVSLPFSQSVIPSSTSALESEVPESDRAVRAWPDVHR
jgi:hypothetical protein